jgi:hypothetical protein
MIVIMKCLNEERSAKRVVEDFHDEDFVDRIIVIDGGSTDYTAYELKPFKKVEIYLHPWLDWYHDMEISQSNIALSYVPHGQIAFILDFDERITDPLRSRLTIINKDGMPGGHEVIKVPRQTFELVRYDDPEPSPHAVIGEDGWPVVSHQIGQYPDHQIRIIKRNPTMHWVNSPHHTLVGQFQMFSLPDGEDIVHYEKDDFRDRDRIEKKWLRAQARRKELGLTADVYETKVRPEWAEFANPRYWRF